MALVLQPLFYIPFSILVIALTAIYLWSKNAANFWKNKNIPNMPALPFWGNFKEIILMKKTIAMKLVEFHFSKETKDAPIYGINMFYKPALVIKDLELVKRIMVKDFNSFSDR